MKATCAHFLLICVAVATHNPTPRSRCFRPALLRSRATSRPSQRNLWSVPCEGCPPPRSALLLLALFLGVFRVCTFASGATLPCGKHGISECCRYLCTCPLLLQVGPSYAIVGGASAGQGVILTMAPNATAPLDSWYIPDALPVDAAAGGKFYVLETSKDRRRCRRRRRAHATRLVERERE